VEVRGVEGVVEFVGVHPVWGVFGALGFIQGEKLGNVNGFKVSDAAVASGFDPPAFNRPALSLKLSRTWARRVTPAYFDKTSACRESLLIFAA
jgi:hypothetical protein